MNSMLVKLATNFPEDGQHIAVIGTNKIVKLSDKDHMALSRHCSENHGTINKPPLQKACTPLLLSNNQVVTLWISVKTNGIT